MSLLLHCEPKPALSVDGHHSANLARMQQVKLEI